MTESLKCCNFCERDKLLSEFWTRKSYRMDGTFIRIPLTVCKVCWKWRQRQYLRKRMKRPAWLVAYRERKAGWAREHYARRTA